MLLSFNQEFNKSNPINQQFNRFKSYSIKKYK